MSKLTLLCGSNFNEYLREDYFDNLSQQNRDDYYQCGMKKKMLNFWEISDFDAICSYIDDENLDFLYCLFKKGGTKKIHAWDPFICEDQKYQIKLAIEICKAIKNNNKTFVIKCYEILFEAFRMCIRYGLISPEDIEVRYYHDVTKERAELIKINPIHRMEIIKLNKHGSCEYWPTKMFDDRDNISYTLMFNDEKQECTDCKFYEYILSARDEIKS